MTTSPNSDHGEPRDALGRALQDVPIPEGLEERILASLEAPLRLGSPHTGWTRRGWLTAAMAAGCSGLMIGTGSYAWLRRPLSFEEIQRAVHRSLTQRNWRLPWNQPPSDRTVNGIPFPRDVRTINGWQYRSLSVGGHAVAYDVSLTGCVAVLFAMKTWRDISHFESSPPVAPVAQSGLPWKSLAIWQQHQRYLYVLAVQGSRGAYERVIASDGAARLA